MRLHHVQVGCPPGGEDAARAFYVDGLGLTEVAKPEALRARGGAWFRARDDDGAVTAELHVGVEDPFRPAVRAHPALLLDDVAGLDRTADRLAAAGHEVDHTERHTFDGFVRVHVRDPHGNRVELLVPA
ncbi:VOC family protein [Nocardioides plantarum]|uniref:VOC family protein n=1 Tax=Nocardioides plantarum TaxID=29299 RepID=A0ABV5K985_9ACTN|nr:VOC family protein [Nocardioides plantarum]